MSLGGISCRENQPFLNEKTFRLARVVCLLILCLAGRLSADEVIIPDTLLTSGKVIEPTSESTSGRMRVSLDGGLFFPVGKWSDGFDPGVSIGAGFDLPLKERIDFGGRFSWFTLKRDDRTFFKWLSMEAQVTFYPPIDITRVEPFITGSTGLLLAAVEVGEGREDEWDLLVGAGGGIGVPISDDFRLVGTVLWRRVMGGGQGFHFTGGLSFPVL